MFIRHGNFSDFLISSGIGGRQKEKKSRNISEQDRMNDKVARDDIGLTFDMLR